LGRNKTTIVGSILENVRRERGGPRKRQKLTQRRPNEKSGKRRLIEAEGVRLSHLEKRDKGEKGGTPYG